MNVGRVNIQKLSFFANIAMKKYLQQNAESFFCSSESAPVLTEVAVKPLIREGSLDQLLIFFIIIAVFG